MASPNSGCPQNNNSKFVEPGNIFLSQLVFTLSEQKLLASIHFILMLIPGNLTGPCSFLCQFLKVVCQVVKSHFLKAEKGTGPGSPSWLCDHGRARTHVFLVSSLVP
uniref:Uncharacterized protein n=1 Tax=Micrurus surinamensis TaxID=129470 RepID=A0A2D4NZK5_MICSU